MKIIIFLILPILIALTWKYISIASETLRQLQQGKEPEIDPMQSAILPEIIVMLILSPIFHLAVKLFDPINSVKFVALGQLTLLALLLPFVARFWWGLKQFKP
ncbi:hypothetical protein QWI17_13720 [Gilvimarinus sp. SDUM040013]|uniref:Uncharacterized protein n=1 Tax=Gilvimarinus gilvus TaxID=3058038 RepID=A0ABU4S2X9_9GAMM|nr:hypothetical protein [Gilvimarinus sp. SDUM040013]MDO3386900.1 hypothetical protein [Gilvimarinus sp. SDUM040013]MDX6851534.1 hypothetical protein [Gilvimarinus sp. SDUM040013]